MGRLITFMEFCSMRNMPGGYAGLNCNAKLSTKLLETNVAGGVLQLTKDSSSQPKIDNRFLTTDTAGGLVTLDETGKLRNEVLPSYPDPKFKGEFSSVTALRAAYPRASLADYAYVEHEGYYYWNPKLSINGMVTPRWVKQLITHQEYLLLNEEAKLAVHYIIYE